MAKFDIDLVEGIYNGRPLHSAEFIGRLVGGSAAVGK